MTNNVSAVWDDAFNYSMWVEIYNPGNVAVNQSLYYFTDDPAVPRKWQLPAMYLGGGSYNTIWFERPEIANHASFKLNPEGGRLFLVTATGAVIDFVNYPVQFRNVSYGRKNDGIDEWVYFTQHSKSTSNNGKKFATQRCADPVFTLPGGFYKSGVNIKFEHPLPGDTIFYTLNGTEPSNINGIKYTPGATSYISSNTVVRAVCMGAGKIPGRVVTSTFLIGLRKFTLPVVSIVTPQQYLTDNKVGIYVMGTNGIINHGTTSPANWNQDWDRPANFELIDPTNKVVINQELDIQIAGGWSRTINPQKSLHIQPKKKFENNKLNYNLFPMTKPGYKFKDIMLRNAGNDFQYSMMRDGFIQSLIINRIDLDYVAYEPAVLFMNGEYYGIQNLRERTNADYLYTNYGLNEEDVTIIDQLEIPTNTEYLKLINFIKSNDINNEAVFTQLGQMMDVDNYISYMITQIYSGNYDWPHNNIKMWKKKPDGKWRWILFDLDFGYNLYDTDLHNFNALTYAMGEASSKSTQAWATELFKRLMVNDTFRNSFIDRASIHLSSTFEYNRCVKIMDSIAAKIKNEIVFHKSRWTGSARSFDADINNMKTFAANRSNVMLNHISGRFLNGAGIQNITLTSNIGNASYSFNGELIKDANIQLKSFSDRNINLLANKVKGYDFKHWEVLSAKTTQTLISWGSNWKYYDETGMPATNWTSADFSDTAWKSGASQLGYGGKGEATTISFGSNSSNKNITAYFRQNLNIVDVRKLSNVIANIFVDDGAALYVNGTEIGRYNLPSGTLNFSTLATTFNNGEYASFNIPLNILKNGNNLIAVEVHQNAVNSSDLIFNLQLNAEVTDANLVQQTPIYTSKLQSVLNLRAVYQEDESQDPFNTATLSINEIVSSNNLLSDEYGDKDDFIELYNYGDKPVNLTGFYLSDNRTNLKLSQITSVQNQDIIIAPGAFKIIWCDENPAQGSNHAGFKLSKDGEFVALSVEDKFGILHAVDSVTFPAMDVNMSYARVPDGKGILKIQQPTAGISNVLSGYEENENSQLKVFPVQTTGLLQIANARGKTIWVTDAGGKQCMKLNIESEQETLDLSMYAPGIYFVSDGIITCRIIRK